MASELERLVVSLEARTASFEKAMQRAAGTMDRQAKRIETRVSVLRDKIASSFTGMGRGLLAGLAAGFSVREVSQLSDAATRIDNALKVAGLSGAELEKVYGRLRESAIANAAPLESLVTLYGRASMAANNLGASQDDLTTFADNVALSLRVSGKSAEEASGALLQLSQILGGAKVQSEEYNSLIDGAYPLLQAVAAGLKEAGGDVGKLTQLVKAGEVPTKAFFEAFQAGASILRDKVANSTITLSQASNNLATALLDTAREFNNSTGASERFAGGLNNVAVAIADVDVSTFITKIQNATTTLERLLNEAGNADVFKKLNQALGLTDADGKVINPAVKESADDVKALEREVKLLQATIEKNAALAIDNKEALERLRDVSAQLARLKAQAANIPVILPTVPATPFREPANPPRPVAAKQVSLADFAPPSEGDSASGEKFRALGTDMATAFIKKFEGFISKAKWDVNAFRVGYGSDTLTGAGGGVSKVLENTMTTVEAANRDLARRIEEFQKVIAGQIGSDNFAKLSEEQLAALSSIAYNYGELPDRIVNAIMQGGDVASAIRGLASDNNGINANRRNQEAALYSGQIGLLNVDGIDAATDAWEGLRGATDDAGAATKKVSKAYELLDDIAQTTLDGIADALADGKITGQELLGILFDIAKQLLRMPSGGMSGFGSFLGGIFGFDQGGYTGPGPKKKAAGIVHKGEVVFSQDDVRRHGGPAKVDAMRRGMAGFADGGIVGLPIPSLVPRAIPQRAGAAGDREITLRVIGEEGPMFRPTIQAESKDVAVRVVKQSAPQIVKQSTKQVRKGLPSMLSEVQYRNF